MSAGIRSLRCEFLALCRRLGGRCSFHTVPQHDGAPHVERIDGFYYYVVTERGRELDRRVASDRDEILYWLIRDVAVELALDYELKHRVDGQDFRRVYFAKTIELLGLLNPAWATRKREEFERVLAVHPFRD